MTPTPDIPSTGASTSRRRPVLRFLRKRWQYWHSRHQLPFNLTIHLVGIPLALAGVVLLFIPGVDWYWGVAAIVLGYLLQFLGHQAEGNDVGEWAALKRLAGLPYVAVAPRWQKQTPSGEQGHPGPSGS
jgi:hypothetical protein